MVGTAKDVIRLESQQLCARLGRVTEGGIIEALEPIGGASVPELGTRPATDIGLAVWPFPLTPEHRSVVTSLGYTPVTGYEDVPEQRFFHSGKRVQLFFTEPGSSHWTNHLLVRDFLRRSENARQRFLSRGHLQPDKVAFFAALLKDAEAWWTAFHGFTPVEVVRHELEAFGCPWLISSGWALDLFVGRVSRVHHDVDVVIPRSAVELLRRYLTDRAWKLVLPRAGRLEPWLQTSAKKPDTQLHAHRDGAFIDFLITDLTAERWVYRRDPRVTCSAQQALWHTGAGISCLAPELVLLFKSKNTGSRERPQDQQDFDTVYPYLKPNRRCWLRRALTLTDPTHPWLERLG